MNRRIKRARAPADPIVFLSSTFRDLAPHREVLKLALESSRYRVFGMETFTADPWPPLTTCLAELAQSQIYVGVIGEYYGSSPPGYKKSYTQLEYETAVKMKLPMFLFFTAEDAALTPAQFEKDPEKLKRLERFKEALKKHHTIAFFRDPNEVAWQILAALRKHELKMWEEQYKK